MTDEIFDTSFLVGLSIWFVITGFTGAFVSHASRSVWKGVVTTLVLFAGPLWDLPFGLAMYKHYARELGGVRIFERVSAEGFLYPVGHPDFDGAISTLLNAATSFEARKEFPYSYIEFKVDVVPQYGFIQKPGYWEIRLLAHGSPECADYEQWVGGTAPGGAGKPLRELHPYADLTDLCVAATRRDAPRSRYQWEVQQPFVGLPGPRWLPPVMANWERYVDRQTGRVVAQNYGLQYQSWFPMPHIDDARPLSWLAGRELLRTTDVIFPENANTKSPREL